MSLTEVLLLITGLLGVGFVYERGKRRSAEALNDNLETKEKLLEKDKKISENDASIKLEEERQKQIKKQIEEDRNESKTNLDDIIDFFRKR